MVDLVDLVFEDEEGGFKEDTPTEKDPSMDEEDLVIELKPMNEDSSQDSFDGSC